MKVLVASAFRRQGADRPQPPTFPANVQTDSMARYDSDDQPVTFRVDASGTTAERFGVPLSLPRRLATIRNSEQLRLMLDAHDLVATSATSLELEILPLLAPGMGT